MWHYKGVTGSFQAGLGRRAGDPHRMPYFRAGDSLRMPHLRAGDAFRMPIIMSKIRKMMINQRKGCSLEGFKAIFHHIMVFLTTY